MHSDELDSIVYSHQPSGSIRAVGFLINFSASSTWGGGYFWLRDTIQDFYLTGYENFGGKCYEENDI